MIKKLTKSQLSPTHASTKRKITDELKHNAGWYEVREGSPVEVQWAVGVWPSPAGSRRASVRAGKDGLQAGRRLLLSQCCRLWCAIESILRAVHRPGDARHIDIENIVTAVL